MNAPRPDAELLAAFAGRADQTAFAELVERHGPMVVRVAEAILRDRHGAEDVAQAAFLVLARKAAGLRRSETVAPWLHRVAWRLAIDELRRRQRRQRREEENVRMNTPASPADLSAVHEELGALPDRYRSALVLCYLEGEPQEPAARQLGLSAAALRKRLERGRELLRKKLVRRGVTVGSVGALTALLSAESGATTLPATFVASTVSAATGGSLTAAVATLTTKAITIMAMTKLKLGAIAAATVLLLLGGGLLWVRESSAPPSVPPPETRTISPPKTVAETAPAVVTAATTEVATGRGLILRQANPPMELTDSRGRRYVAKKIEDLKSLPLWAAGMNIGFVQAFRLTAAEQIRLQQLWDTLWQGGDAYGTMFDITESNGVLAVKWKGDVFLDAYRSQRQQVTSQVLDGARGILGDERAEVLSWLPQVGNIHYPNLLPEPTKPIGEYQFTVSVTNANGVIAMRYQAKTSTGGVSGQNPGLGPWPGLGEQLGVPRSTVTSSTATRRSRSTTRRLPPKTRLPGSAISTCRRRQCIDAPAGVPPTSPDAAGLDSGARQSHIGGGRTARRRRT